MMPLKNLQHWPFDRYYPHSGCFELPQSSMLAAPLMALWNSLHDFVSQYDAH